MKVVIAAWHVRDFNVGLGRYARELIESIGRVDPINEYTVLLPDAIGTWTPRPNVRFRVLRLPLFKRRVWEQVTPLFGGRCDLLHMPYDSCVAWPRSKFVVTIHDLKPLVVGPPKARPNLNERIEAWAVGDRWAKIDHVLTDSRCSERDILTHCPVTADRLSVVYPGVDTEKFRPHATGSGGGQQAGAERPYVFCVAGDDPMKNVETLVDAFAQLPPALRAAHDLVLAGDVQKRAVVRERVRAHGLSAQVRFPGIVDDAALVRLYQGARLFVFPSRYEGFGLPVLEAMASGCPVVSSNASSLPEVVGEAGLLVDPLDSAGFARAMADVLDNARVHAAWVARGFAQVQRFTWERTARETIAVYQRIVDGP